MNIQSKYCKTGSKCIRECFDGNRFRYYNSDGTPMQIEVPADKYDDAVKAMQDRIDKCQVPGVTDAHEIVRKGNITYEQAKNIAKAGTVESLTYDAANGIIIGALSGGTAAGKVSQKVTDEIIEDDAKEMIRVFEDEFKIVADDFLLNKNEGKQVSDLLSEKLKDGSKMKDMYASNNRPKFARELLESCAEIVVRRRKKISLPSTQDYIHGLRKVLENAADNESDKRFSQFAPKASKTAEKSFACRFCGCKYDGNTSPEVCPMQFHYFCAEDF